MAFLPTKQLLHIHFMHLVGQLTYSTIVMLVWSFSCVYLLLLQTNKIYVYFFIKLDTIATVQESNSSCFDC